MKRPGKGPARCAEPAEKICAACGRRIEWRKKWAGRFNAVRYCGERCRRQRSGARGRRIEAALRERAARAKAGATFCPSEVARALAPDDWRDWMEPVRAGARRLVARGELEMLQAGARVDPSKARGPIRLRGVRSPACDSLVRRPPMQTTDDEGEPGHM